MPHKNKKRNKKKNIKNKLTDDDFPSLSNNVNVEYKPLIWKRNTIHLKEDNIYSKAKKGLVMLNSFISFENQSNDQDCD